MEVFCGMRLDVYGDSVRITNGSGLGLWVSVKPEKPKRKYVDILYIRPHSSFFIERKFEIDKLSFSFVEE